MVSDNKKLYDTKCFDISLAFALVGASFALVGRAEGLTGRAFNASAFMLAALIVCAIAVFSYKKNKNRDKSRLAVAAIMSVLCTFSLLFFTESSKSVIWVIAFICLNILLNSAFKSELTENVAAVSLAAAILFSVIILVGSQLAEYERLDFLYLSDKTVQQIFLPFCRLTYLVFLFFVILTKIYTAVLSMSPDALISRSEKKPKYILTFFICTGIVFFCWLPYYLAFYPAVISEDSLSEIMQQTGREALSNHHPIIHQFFIGLCLKATGTLTLGLGLFSLLQMLFLASAFSTGIVFLQKHGVRQAVLAVLLAVYALFPVNAFFGITVWKDVPFAACSVFLSVILLTETEKTPDRRLFSGILFLAAAFGFCTFRNNGFYAFVFGMVLYVIFNRNNRKRIIILTVLTLCAVMGYQHILFDVMGISKSNPAEALSVPVQQVARVVSIDGIDDGDENIAVLREIFPDLEQTAENYTPTFADHVKGNPKRGYALFNGERFSGDPIRYFKSWAGLGLEHPVKYLEAFLLQSYGYWYPDINVNIVASYIVDNELGLEHSDRFENLKTGLFMSSEALIRHQPTAIIFGIGFLVWVLFLCAVILCMKGQGKLASALFVILGLWLTTLLSPVYCEYRYIYGLIVVVPIYAVIALSAENKRINT